MATVVDCPTCGARVEWGEASRWRPFCSERCKLVDLGDWATDRHRIAGAPAGGLIPDETPAAKLQH